MIAPSIKIPTDRISENKTTILIVIFRNERSIIDIKKEPGIEILTRIAGLYPIQEIIIIKTSIIAKITLFSKSLIIELIAFDSS